MVKERFRTNKPCSIPLQKGVLILNQSHQDESTLNRLINQGVPIFRFSSIDMLSDWMSSKHNELSWFFYNILSLTDLNGAKDYCHKGSYFFLRNDKLIVHQRSDNKEYNLG